MIEIFKTDVGNKTVSKRILTILNRHFPNYKINFDLDDCDKILRVESGNGYIDINSVMKIVSGLNIEIELIPD